MYKYYEKSYPEKIFEHGLTSNTIVNYVYDYKQGMYYYDFGFPEIKLDVEVDGRDEYKTDGVFIEIGSGPNTISIKKLGIELNERGYVKVAPDQLANINGFYAVGDISTNSNGVRQIITASAEGAIAAMTIFEKNKKK